MKSFITIAVVGLIFTASSASAQLVDTKLNGSAKVDSGVLQTNVGVKATTTVNGTGTVNVNSSATGTINSNNSNSSNTSNNGQSSGANSNSEISITARDIRGWDSDQKQQFLLGVKGSVQVNSDQELENFATGVLVKDENVQAVESTDDSVSVTYKLPAKFLGIFSTDINAMADVTVDSTSSTDAAKEVSVQFPWYRLFYSLNSDARADVISTAVESELSADASAAVQVGSAKKARVIQIVSNVLKSIRAEVSASADATATVN